jgi:MFS transporter, DHA1 family, tetracycline resistance protein
MDRRRLFPITLIIFTNILGAGVIIPILPLYAEGQFAGTILQVTMLSTLFFGAQFIAAPWLGRLSDQIGRRPVLILSQVGTVIAFVLFIVAGPAGKLIDGLGLALPMHITGGMLMLYIARILDGITGGNITTAQAYVSDITPQEDRAQALGLIQAAFGVGFIFGPAFGGVLARFGPIVPFIGAAVITSITALLSTFLLKESLPPENRVAMAQRHEHRVPLRSILSNPALVNILAIGFTSTLAFSALQSTFALFADHVLFIDTTDRENIPLYIALMLVFMGVFTVATQLTLLKPLIQRFGERTLVLLGEISVALGMFGFSQIVSPYAATALMAPIAFGQGVAEPSQQALVTRFATASTRGQLLGVYQSARSFALMLGPIWAGLAYDHISPHAVFLIGSGMLLLAALFALIMLRQTLPSPQIVMPGPAASSTD